MFVQQQSVQEDVFPDAEGWENMDPEEAAKWAVGSDFPPAEGEHSQTETGPAAQMHTGITECLSNIENSILMASIPRSVYISASYWTLSP